MVRALHGWRIATGVVLATVLVAVTLAAAGGAGAAAAQSPREARPSAAAAGKVGVVNLAGTFRQMGRQYGRFLAKEIRGLNREVRRQYKANGVAVEGESLRAFSRRSLGLYPARFRQLARGVAEGAGVDIGVIAENSESFDYFAASVPAPSPPGTSRGPALRSQPGGRTPGAESS
jgi:hypothetical protein